MTKDLPKIPEETPRTLMTKIGPWELGPTLGRGAYAHVRLATHETGYVSACKILPALHGPIPRKVTRDQRIDAVEAHKELVMLKGLAGAGVPGIVGLEGVIPYQGWNFIFLSMYPYSAATVSSYPNHIIPFFRRLLLSIHALHALNISHEDLKRSNVLATTSLEPVLVDFGFAHFVPDGGHVRSLGGTMDYSSPEKLGDGYYDPFRSEIWSLGILLLKLLGMHNPYRLRSGETEESFKHKLFNTSPSWDFLGHFGTPGMIGDVIRGMLERDPDERWDIPTILAHPAMQTIVPDPEPFSVPSCHLSDDIRLTEDIILDVAFMAYNIQAFQLCESLGVIVETIVSDEPNWQKQWAGMLGRWKQREETLWEDVPSQTAVNTPHAKARGARLSAVDVAKVSRASLKPLREIHLTTKKVNIATAHRPAPDAPLTPRRRGTKKPAPAAQPKAPRKSLETGANPADHSPSTPLKKAFASGTGAAVQTPPKRTRQGEPRVYKAAAPRVAAKAPAVRTKRTVKPLSEPREGVQATSLIPTQAPTPDLIDLNSERIITAPPSSQATLAPTRRATHDGTITATTRRAVSKDKENIAPPGERATTGGLRPALRGDVNPLQPTRRSPRFA